MIQKHTAPQLTPDGAQLLADVLEKRKAVMESEEPVVVPLDATSPRRGLPILVGLAIGAAIVGAALVWFPAPETVSTEVQGASEVSAQLSSSELAELAANIGDVTPTNDGVRSFSLRLFAGVIGSEIALDQITVSVESSDGTVADTFVRFEQSFLAADSSARATVRAEGVGSGESVAIIRLGEIEIERISLD